MSPRPAHSVFRVSEGGNGPTVHFPAGTALTDAHVEAVRRHPLAAGREHSPLTLDLAGVTAMSSGALGKLLALDRAVRAGGGRLALVNPTANIRRVFKLTRTDAILDVRDAEAVSV